MSKNCTNHTISIPAVCWGVCASGAEDAGFGWDLWSGFSLVDGAHDLNDMEEVVEDTEQAAVDSSQVLDDEVAVDDTEQLAVESVEQLKVSEINKESWHI